MNRFLLLLCLGGLITGLSHPALAQSPAKTGTLGGGGGEGKAIMTRDELRTCIKQQAALKIISESYEAKKKQLALDREALLADTKNVVGDLDDARAKLAKVNDINRRTAEVAEQVTNWNSRWAAFQESKRSGPIAERQRRQLGQEQADLAAKNKVLDTEREQLGGAAGGASDANAKSEALNARTVAWNERNTALVAEGESLSQEREFWASECGNRRFREDDENAIRKDK